ncbi:DUF5753 domain-containing protein [Actinomadura terrae]|uniref:DUF5753 domain-containing protein n=1 Tax=Actinomadura terrae TaxID=604353 RepID=UPI001FA7462C|nr:DUF5753 domain-containing protein [Actinomadura terrae]
MAIKPSPDPRNSMWDFIAYYLRVWRRMMQGHGPRITEILKISEATLSRLEHNQRRLSGDEATKIDKAWGTGGVFGLLVWYASIGHDPQWFAQYLHLERVAEIISTFEAQVIPGLLQTEEYARSLLIAGDATRADALLRARIERQMVLTRDPAPHLSIVMSQNALEWPVGSPAIMREQIERVLEASTQPNFVVRVVPRTWATGAYPGLDGSFTRMTGEFGDVVYTESPEGGRLVSTPAELRAFAVRYDRISAKALPEEPSRELIKHVLEEYHG